jgi:hypothetical protein
MRIALVLSGQPRNLSKCFPSLFKYLIELNSPDIFYHAWWDENLIGTNFDSAQPNQVGLVGSWDPDTLQLLELLNSKKSLVEKPINFDVSRLNSAPTANQNSMSSIFYSQWKSGLLKQSYERENKFVYDAVIRTRFDLIYNEKIKIEDILIKPETVVLASKWQDIRQVFIPGLGDYTMDDNFAIGDSITIDKYLSVFPQMEELNTKIHPPFAENYLGWHCKKDNSIQVETQKFSIEISHRVR